MKKTPLKRRTPLRGSKLSSKAPKKRKRTSPHKYQPPDWFKAIKPGSHGRTPHQKKLWRMVSEMVRKEDFEKYGKCVSCPKRFSYWQEAHAGHYKAWSVCNGMFKYERRNLASQCADCNRRSDGPVGFEFGEELKRRYGPNHLEWIEKENKKYHGTPLDILEIVALAEKIRNYEV